MKYEDIENANKQIRTLEIERKDKKTNKVIKKEYAEVNQRIKAFRMVYPEGCIKTEMLKNDDGICVIKASVYSQYMEIPVGDTPKITMQLLGTGYAFEDQSSSFINNTSYIENCETSAVGRALGMCGFGIDTAVASYDEMKSVENAELHNRLEIQVKINKLMNEKKILPNEVLDHFNKKSSDMSDDELLEVVTWLEGIKNES